jgi:hypothetical protein
MTKQVDLGTGSGNPLLENHARLVYNREVFLANCRFGLHGFTRIDENFGLLGGMLTQRRDKAGFSHVSLVPFILVMQRQVYAAFELISTYQSFQAWVLLRPCLESALIMGKWVDDPCIRRCVATAERRFRISRRTGRRISGEAWSPSVFPGREISAWCSRESTMTSCTPTSRTTDVMSNLDLRTQNTRTWWCTTSTGIPLSIRHTSLRW